MTYPEAFEKYWARAEWGARDACNEYSTDVPPEFVLKKIAWHAWKANQSIERGYNQQRRLRYGRKTFIFGLRTGALL